MKSHMSLLCFRQKLYFNYGFTELDYLTGKHRILTLNIIALLLMNQKVLLITDQIYKPKSYIDSLAFPVMVSSDLT
jgi:hypothetical protein